MLGEAEVAERESGHLWLFLGLSGADAARTDRRTDEVAATTHDESSFGLNAANVLTNQQRGLEPFPQSLVPLGLGQSRFTPRSNAGGRRELVAASATFCPS